MKVCLVRHGVAAERGPEYPDDALRPLTAEGRMRMESAARGLATLLSFDAVLTSPLVRAAQTAALIAAAQARPVTPVVCEPLGAGDHRAVLAALADVPSRAVVALAGHEPWMSELLSLLVTGDEQALGVSFKKGAAALVESAPFGTPIDEHPQPGRCALTWFLTPAVLRALA